MKNSKVSKIAGNGILVAIEIVLAFVSNYVSFGTLANLNLALIPIAIGAIIYGPWTGLLLGLINGIITLTSPSTIEFFFIPAPIGAILTCTLKTGVGGLVASFIFKAFVHKKYTVGREFAGSALASLSVPILNTGLFVVGSLLFFIPAMTAANMIPEGQTAFKAVVASVLTVNFIIEVVLTIVLTPAIARLINFINKRHLKKKENKE